MERTKWLVYYIFLHISFLSTAVTAQDIETVNFIKLGGIDFPLTGGYKVKSDLFLEQGRLVLDKIKGVGVESTIESSIVISSTEKCGKICNEDFKGGEFLKVLSECSYGKFTSRSLVISFDGISTVTGIIFIGNKSIGITNNKRLFDQWTNIICLNRN